MTDTVASKKNYTFVNLEEEFLLESWTIETPYWGWERQRQQMFELSITASDTISTTSLPLPFT